MKNVFIKNHKCLIVSVLAGCCMLLAACSKKLDMKPNQALLVPVTLEDFQAIANSGLSVGTVYGEISADNYYILDTRYNALALDKQAIYTWGNGIFPAGQGIIDWNAPYNRILNANAILEGLAKINPGADSTLYKSLYGTGHFIRALALYQLAQLFCKPYDPATAATDPGVPIRLTADINDRQGRASVRKVYDQILQDTRIAEQNLPTASSYKTRPIKSAASALLARTYLLTGQYELAEQAADTSLYYYSTLLDFNQLNAGLANPVPLYNPEVLFHSDAVFGGISSVTYVGNFFVDTALYASYAQDDLRRSCFFKTEPSGQISYKGSYTGNSTLTWFTGLATDEVYLIRAECRARTGDLQGGIDDLNALLRKRIRQVSFVPVQAATAEQLLSLIITERRKELIFRGIRWSDLRRLNTDPQFATTLTRLIAGNTYTLEPGSNRYVLPIPGDELLYNPIEQNPR